MIKTFYTDKTQVRQLVHDFPGNERALLAGAELDDMGISICNRKEDFDSLCQTIPEHLWLGGWRFKEDSKKYFLVLHRRMDHVLPETLEASSENTLS